jgi:hemerythrin
MQLIDPRELLLNCPFADVEHLIIGNALNALATLIEQGKKEEAFDDLLPAVLDYLQKHLTHEERVLENAFSVWCEENDFCELYESFKNYLKTTISEGETDSYSTFLKVLETFKEKYPDKKDFFDVLELVEHQKYGHKNIVNILLQELKILDVNESPKKIIQQLGLILSFILNRVLKLDSRYVEFYRKYNLPACEERPYAPQEVIELLKNILGDEFVDPYGVNIKEGNRKGSG